MCWHECTVNGFSDIRRLHCALSPIMQLSKSSPSFMWCVPLLILHLCVIIITILTDSNAHKLWHAFPTHTHSASWFSLPFLPRLPSGTWMDRSVHTSPQLQTHPCCYIRAMQRLTNQIIIVTGHTLREDRGQWSSMANQWTDAGMNLDRGHGGTPALSGCSSDLPAHDVYLSCRYRIFWTKKPVWGFSFVCCCHGLFFVVF